VFHRRQPYGLYLFLSGASSFLMTTIWVVGAVYYVLSVHMNPFQLVLVGTSLELSYLLFQVPTGLCADMFGRRRSIVLGGVLVGFCWLAEGLIPLFVAILAAEAFRGLGEAFIDGAQEAWLSDELGQERFGQATVRAAQIAQLAGIAGMPAGVALASIHLYLPMAVGGILVILLHSSLLFLMPEEHFRRAPLERAGHHLAARQMLHGGVRLVRGRPLLLGIIAIALVFGAHSEGFDRLWEAHFLLDIPFPHVAHATPVIWFGVINIGVGLLLAGVFQIMLRRIDLNDHAEVARTLLAVNVMLIIAVVTFGLAGNFPLAVGAFVVARVMRQLSSPLSVAWLNQHVNDSRIRATVLSLRGGADAVGQSAFGPLVGLVGTLFSLRAAIVTAGLILLPALPLFGWTLHEEPEVAESGTTGSKEG